MGIPSARPVPSCQRSGPTSRTPPDSRRQPAARPRNARRSTVHRRRYPGSTRLRQTLHRYRPARRWGTPSSQCGQPAARKCEASRLTTPSPCHRRSIAPWGPSKSSFVTDGAPSWSKSLRKNSASPTAQAPLPQAPAQPLPERGTVEVGALAPEPDGNVLRPGADEQPHLQLGVGDDEGLGVAGMGAEQLLDGGRVVARERLELQEAPPQP